MNLSWVTQLQNQTAVTPEKVQQRWKTCNTNHEYDDKTDVVPETNGNNIEDYEKVLKVDVSIIKN